MKKKTTLYLILFILLTACYPTIEGESFVGFQIDIVNERNSEINNAKLLIGIITNNNFTATENINIPNLIVKSSENFGKTIAIDENRWKPNLELISKTSNQAHFAIQFESGEIKILDIWRGEGKLTFDVLEDGKVKTFYGNRLFITILEDSVNGSISKDF